MRHILTLLVTMMALQGAPAHAQLALWDTVGGNFSVPVQTISERRFSGVIPQQKDFSCGSAALATLLTYHYERPITEEEALEAMYAVGEQEKIEREGFSLLDMKNYLATLGLRADGYRQSLDQLSSVGIPAIVLINYNGYLHFVVIKGVTDDDVLVGDPALGLRSMGREKFESMWNGILFVIRDDIDIAKSNFNQITEWAMIGQAPITAQATSLQDLSSFYLNLRTAPNYY